MQIPGSTITTRIDDIHPTNKTARMTHVFARCTVALITCAGLTQPAHAQSSNSPDRQRPSKTARADESAPLIITVDQLPKDVGNRWTFQVSARDKNIDGKKHYYSFHDKIEYQGKTFLRRRAEIPGVVERTDGLQLLQADGWFGYWDPDDEVPYDVIKLPLSAGMEWEQDVLFKTSDGDKHLLWNRWHAEAEETITVPAGTFRCIRLRGFKHTLDKGDDVLAWLAPDTGLLKWTYLGEDLTGELILFERSASLPEAAVGARTTSPEKEFPHDPIEINAEETAKLDRTIRGTIVGIGVSLEKSEKGFTIKNTLPDAPAERAGLQAGSVITDIDGLSTGPMTPDQAVKLISGPIGTEVELIVLSPGASTPRRVVLTREQVVLSKVTSRMLDEKIGLLTITRFNKQTAKGVREALRHFRGDKVRGLVVDLRNNTGGTYPAVVNVASMLVGKNRVLWQLQKSEEQDMTRVRGENRSVLRCPKVALISAKTSSGGELLASALKTSGKAKLLGQKTAGKGTVGDRIKRPDGTSVRVTTAYLFTADGEPINGVGISPDRKIDTDTPAEDVLQMAIDELRGQGT